MKLWIVNEVCPHCEYENHYFIKRDTMVARCGDCGKWIVLCDKCVQMHGAYGTGDRNCANCKWCDEADRKNRRRTTNHRRTKRSA